MKILVLDFIFKIFLKNVLQGGFHIASVVGIGTQNERKNDQC